MAPSFVHAAALALRASSAALCPSSPTCPQDDQCIYTANGASLQVSCATDFYGGDLTLAQTSTLERCMTLCASTSTCVAASYVGQNCYLKSSLTSAQPNANVIGVAVTTRPSSPPPPATTPGAPATCPSSFTCPENDGCSFTDGSKTLTLTCGTDFYGGDSSSQYAGSLQECTQACASNADCVAASFTGGKGPGYCYLKSQKNGASNNDYVDAVYVIVASTPTSSTVQSSTTLSATPSPSGSSSSSSAQSATSVSSSPLLSSTSTELLTSTSSAPSLSSTNTELSTSTSSAPASSSTSSSTPISSAIITSPSTTATPTPTPSTSSTTPSAPQYTNFCLRVITPTSPVYGAIIHNGNPGQNLILGNVAGLTFPVAFFSLDSTGRLATAAGFQISPFQPTLAYSNLRPFTQASIDRTPSGFKQEYCTVTQSRELVCAATGTQYVYSVFVQIGANPILSVADPSGATAPLTTLNLGLFFGDKCVDGSSL